MDIKTLKALNSLTEMAQQITAPKSEYKKRLGELMDQVAKLEALQHDMDTKIQVNAKLDAELQVKLDRLERQERTIKDRDERSRKQAGELRSQKAETGKLLIDAQALYKQREDGVRQLDADRQAFEKMKTKTEESLVRKQKELDQRAVELSEKEQRIRNAIG